MNVAAVVFAVVLAILAGLVCGVLVSAALISHGAIAP